MHVYTRAPTHTVEKGEAGRGPKTLMPTAGIWWYRCVILAVGKLRQEDYKSKAIMGFMLEGKKKIKSSVYQQMWVVTCFRFFA